MRINRICKIIGLSLAMLCSAAFIPTVHAAQGELDPTVPQTWQLLDYLATDYAAAVKNGAVIDAFEYAEMVEFATTSRSNIKALKPTPAQGEMVALADTLVASIDAKASAAEVSKQAHALADALLLAHPMPASPKTAPDLVKGANLYQSQCASCHGSSGRGDGPAGATLEPPPVDFTDQSRADQRSALSLYEVINQGVQGTAMPSYSALTDDDRWALAYYSASLAYAKEAKEGAAKWKDDASARGLIGNLEDLSRARVAALAPTLGVENTRAIIGYLRENPAAAQSDLQGIALARARLAASVDAYRSGNASRATQLALSAYLDGVEPVEPQLNVSDRALRLELERAMGVYRTALSRGVALDVVLTDFKTIDDLLVRADERIAASAGDAATTFIGSFTILVREGLEALLIVIALLAFLRKAQRPEAVRYVHAGWIVALLAGVATWAAASYFIVISGAGRELTEGLSALFAAVVLLAVGLWMHQKSIGGRWQSYLKEKMSAALNRHSAWFLFVLSFISVYREVFESILFYTALWSAGHAIWLLAGIAAGALALTLLAWILLRTSRRLPLAKFFAASSALIAILAVVLTGKGISALQEAGWIGVTPAPLPHIELLGIASTWETTSAQLAVVAILAGGFLFNWYHSAAPHSSKPQTAR